MNEYAYPYSESLVLSLSKEIEYIRSRSRNINYSLENCQNKILLIRLRCELNKLNKKRLKIISITEDMLYRNYNELSIELLLEITKRSNSFQQI